MPVFVIHAGLAGLMLACLTGPLGSLIIWRRMAYFGETMAHTTMLGIGLSLSFGVNPYVGVTLVCILLALLLARLQAVGSLSSDTLLGIMSHGALALGLLVVSLSDQPRINLDVFLFGDLLTVSRSDLLLIAMLCVGVLSILAFFWRDLVSITVQEELAAVEGVKVPFLNTLFLCMVALTIALGIKLLGVILTTAMLIIPGATARRLSQSPEQMAGLAIACGSLGVIGGLTLSMVADTPTGPSVISANMLLFGLSWLLPQR